MFGSCSQLISINFGNMNTSSVENMRSLFYGCFIISSIDLSSFDTSQVTTFQWMFYNCSKLKYLNLSNFNTSKVTNIYQMFGGCVSLTYLNLDLFQLNNLCNITGLFINIPSYVRYCINDNKTKYLLEGNNSIPICSDTCINENNTKIDIFNNNCIESCINIGYQYEYKSVCYKECPNNTYSYFGEERGGVTTKKCFAQLPEGYYIDLNSKTYKKCYDICKKCSGEGNETNNNCIKCKNQYHLYYSPNNNINCYKTCNNYYFFDESNNFNCTST